MCGLTGFIGKGKFDINKIKLLLAYNEIRGKDSTGVYTPIMEDEILKDTKQATDWLALNHFDEDKLLIGHTRAKTKGAATIENAHPFKYGTVIGAHNGTLENHLDLLKENDISTYEFNVDSQVIFKLLDEFKDPRVLYDFEGAAAVLFTITTENTKNSNTLYAFRNNKRPLYKGKTSEGIYFSSLKDSLKAINASDIEELETNVLYKFTDGIEIEKLNIPREDKDIDVTEDYYNGYGCGFNQQKDTSFESTAVKFPIGCYVQVDPENCSIKNKVVTKVIPNKWYLVTDHEVKSQYYSNLIVEFKPGETDWFAPRLFKDKPLILKPDTFAVTTTDLKSKQDGNKIIAKEGEIVHVLHIDHKEGKVDFEIEGYDKILVTPLNKGMIRPLTKPEWEEAFHGKTLQTKFDFENTESDDIEEETEDEAIDKEFTESLEGKQIDGIYIDEFLDGLGEDLLLLKDLIFRSENEEYTKTTGYLSKETRAEIKDVFSQINTGIYEFLYQVGNNEIGKEIEEEIED